MQCRIVKVTRAGPCPSTPPLTRALLGWRCGGLLLRGGLQACVHRGHLLCGGWWHVRCTRRGPQAPNKLRARKGPRQAGRASCGMCPRTAPLTGLHAPPRLRAPWSCAASLCSTGARPAGSPAPQTGPVGPTRSFSGDLVMCALCVHASICPRQRRQTVVRAHFVACFARSMGCMDRTKHATKQVPGPSPPPETSPLWHHTKGDKPASKTVSVCELIYRRPGVLEIITACVPASCTKMAMRCVSLRTC